MIPSTSVSMRSWDSSVSPLSRSRRSREARASPGRLTTSSTMAWLTRIRETSGSGVPLTSFSNVPWPQETKPSGGFLRWTRLSFFGSSPALRTSRAFSISCSGASTTTCPIVS